MLRTRLVLTLAIAGLILAGETSTLFGQELVTQKAISLDMARIIAETTVEHCRSIGFHVSVTVLDANGMIKAFLRDEKTGPHTIDLSRRKAYTALTFANRWPSTGAAAKDWGTTLMSPMPNVEGTTGVGGGVPIKIGDEAIGAVGVSGSVGWQHDEECAKVGIAKIADKLK
jgi:uncharacterized protein GlcG (DUF336 family)